MFSHSYSVEDLKYLTATQQKVLFDTQKENIFRRLSVCLALIKHKTKNYSYGKGEIPQKIKFYEDLFKVSILNSLPTGFKLAMFSCVQLKFTNAIAAFSF